MNDAAVTMPIEVYFDSKEYKTVDNRHRARCSCGRYAKQVSSEWVYLGFGYEYRFTVKCKVHGYVEIY